MINSVLTAFLTSLFLFFAISGLLYVCWILVKRRVSALVTEWFTSPDDKTPSPLATMVDQAAYILAARLVTQIKTTLMGLSSVEARNEKREQADAILQQSPGLAAVLSMIPGARKLMRNPQLLSVAGGLLGKLSGNGHKPDSTGITPGQTKFPF